MKYKSGSTGIGVTCPTEKLNIVGDIKTEFKINKDFNWFDKKLFSLIRWYCTKRKITVTFENTTNGISPNENLLLYSNGNVGIGV